MWFCKKSNRILKKVVFASPLFYRFRALGEKALIVE